MSQALCHQGQQGCPHHFAAEDGRDVPVTSPARSAGMSPSLGHRGLQGCPRHFTADVGRDVPLTLPPAPALLSAFPEALLPHRLHGPRPVRGGAEAVQHHPPGKDSGRGRPRGGDAAVRRGAHPGRPLARSATGRCRRWPCGTSGSTSARRPCCASARCCWRSTRPGGTPRSCASSSTPWARSTASTGRWGDPGAPPDPRPPWVWVRQEGWHGQGAGGREGHWFGGGHRPWRCGSESPWRGGTQCPWFSGNEGPCCGGSEGPWPGAMGAARCP